jgi:hypothetical protein
LDWISEYLESCGNWRMYMWTISYLCCLWRAIECYLWKNYFMDRCQNSKQTTPWPSQKVSDSRRLTA